MSHHLKSVHASVRRRGSSDSDGVVEEVFSSRLRGMNGRLKVKVKELGYCCAGSAV